MLKSHPVIYELVENLRKENKITEDNLIKVKTGLVSNFKSEKLVVEKRLIKILSNYGKNKFDEFYKNLALVCYLELDFLFEKNQSRLSE
ncbi:unnamed protein product [Brachionus calyciflorus]|uniref:Uncharacterized protein n=1 Tax=Brachionus calyciflorus TaxID=104777 RepID=A0A814AD16_9BILA|nr:unnamed protein product [Brachionus calyciflorus]